MKLFNPVNEPEAQAKKFVGFHVITDMDSLLTLYAISMRMSKSALLRSVLYSWLVSKDPVRVLAEQAYILSRLNGEAWSDLPPEKFIALLRSDLKGYKIPDNLIDKVIKAFKAI